MARNPVIFRLNLIIGLLISNIILILMIIIPSLRVLLLNGALPAVLLPLSLLLLLRLR